MALPRGIRNRNVGNMEPGGWKGEQGNDGRFAIFNTMENGIRALCKQLMVYQDKYGLHTVREAINRWAPSVENDTGAYVGAVCSLLECGPDDKFSFHDASWLYWMVVAIGSHENGAKAFTDNVTDAQIDAGVVSALA